MGEQIASAVVGPLIGNLLGSDAPSYQQPSMEQVMTPSQLALQPDLTNIGKLGAKWGQKYFDEDKFNEQNSAYQNTINRLQGKLEGTAPMGMPTAEYQQQQPQRDMFKKNEMINTMPSEISDYYKNNISSSAGQQAQLKPMDDAYGKGNYVLLPQDVMRNAQQFQSNMPQNPETIAQIIAKKYESNPDKAKQLKQWLLDNANLMKNFSYDDYIAKEKGGV